eukprot:TRINITY_DN636_c2_g1_i9.p1 TRINITY_DN636_c2_g1~~TRINITY_DN636_c2_g1_i9.p1  ORF type:complete len:841 (-),score=76.97 TRINITY_DN636_c2_g1_i9:93-2615(-)
MNQQGGTSSDDTMVEDKEKTGINNNSSNQSNNGYFQDIQGTRRGKCTKDTCKKFMPKQNLIECTFCPHPAVDHEDVDNPTTNPGNNTEVSSPKVENVIRNFKEKFNLPINNKLEYLQPAVGHPFLKELEYAKIPVIKGKPSLLLHSLSNKCEFTKTTGEVLSYYERCNADPSIGKITLLLGVSGCSKTRTCYEALCHERGIYLTSSTNLNGGWMDLEGIIDRIDELLVSKSDIDVEQCASHYLRCLLLSRLVVLECCKTMDNFELLLYQTLRANGEDFMNLWEQLALCGDDDVGKVIREKLKVVERDVMLVIDESQVLMNKGRDRFSSANNPEIRNRSLFTCLVRSWSRYKKLHLVISGTGLGLNKAIDRVTSCVGKKGVEDKFAVVTEFGGYYGWSSLRNYLSTFIGDIEWTKELKVEFMKLFGRYRFAAEYVASLCENEYNTKDKIGLLKRTLDEYVKDMTNSTTKYWSILKCIDRLDIQDREEDILFRLCVNYHIWHVGIYVDDKDTNLDLMRIGICHLEKKDSWSYSLKEPLVADAIYVYFEKKGKYILDDVKRLMLNLKFSPQTRGNLFERLMAPSIFMYLHKLNNLGDCPYFNNWKEKMQEDGGVYANFPDWLNYATVQSSSPTEFPKLSDSTEVYFEDWLQNKDDSDLMFPDFAIRHDAIFKIIIENSTKRALGRLQVKLLKEALSGEALLTAVETIISDSAFTTKKGAVLNPKRKENVDRILKEEYESFELGVLVSVEPISKEDHQKITNYLFRRGVVFICVDKNHFREPLSDDTWNFLQMIINDKLTGNVTADRNKTKRKRGGGGSGSAAKKGVLIRLSAEESEEDDVEVI